MIRVMLVDDELLVRMGIKMLVDWESEGFILAGEAANGREALEIWKTVQPDIIITDILMPEMNGIDLMKSLREEDYRGLIAVLSNHDDFNFTRDAIRSGACDYILKSDLNRDDFIQFLHTVSKKLSREIETQSPDRNPFLFQNCLKEIVFDPISESRQMKTKNLPLLFTKHIYRVSLLQIKNPNIDSHQKYRIYQLATGVFTPDRVIFYDGSQGSLQWALLFYGNREDLTDDIIRQKFKLLRSALEAYMHINVFLAAGAVIDNPYLLYADYQNLRDCLWYSFFHDSPVCFFLDEVPPQKLPQDQNTLFRSELERLLAPGNNREENKERLSSLFEIILDTRDGELLKQLVLRVAGTINQRQTRRALENSGDNPPPFQIDTVWKHSTPAELKEFLLENISLPNKADHQPIALIGRSLSFIDEQLSTALTLTEVAEHTGLSRNYFSTWFKEKTGENFSDYLCRRRIERAKDLLKQHPEYRIYEIASLSGFQNEKYFSRLFKSQTGTSPRDYRNRMHQYGT